MKEFMQILRDELKKMEEEPEFKQAFIPRKLICVYCREPIYIGQAVVMEEDRIGETIAVHLCCYADWRIGDGEKQKNAERRKEDSILLAPGERD